MKFLKIVSLMILVLILGSSSLVSCKQSKNRFIISENSMETFSITEFKKGPLIYENSLGNGNNMEDWLIEGPAKVEFKNNWMHMFSPEEEGHHVLWCPKDFPSSFIAEWELQNQETDAGLCIVFFSAQGNNGESIFDTKFPERNGVFKQYTKSKYFNNYHISYYANGKDFRAKGVAHLRKNSGFHKVQLGELGIPENSDKVHKIRLVKDGGHITCFVDQRKIIDWFDDGQEYGKVLNEGKIGLRQMEWTHFKYRNFKVFNLQKQ
jgi:hypothetical protein